MKVKTIGKSFEPITVEITLEDLSDVAILWALSNAPDNDIRKNSGHYPTMIENVEKAIKKTKMSGLSLFNVIDDIAQRNGLRFDMAQAYINKTGKDIPCMECDQDIPINEIFWLENGRQLCELCYEEAHEYDNE